MSQENLPVPQPLSSADQQQARKTSEDLLAFLQESPTAWQAVATAVKALDQAGFRAYDPAAALKLQVGDKGYFVQNSSAILAFKIGENPLNNGFRIFGAHSDSPALKVKPQAVSPSEGVIRLAVEVYGGPLLNTWFDRPLSLAGRVSLKSQNPLQPQESLVDLKDPLLILPNLAIHMENKSNEGQKIERHKEILPFLCLAKPQEQSGDQAPEDLLKAILADHLACRMEDILDYELFTYEVNPPSFCGLEDSFISAGRLDNLAMFKAGLDGLLAASEESKLATGIQVLLITDNEEVGSRTKQGADSLWVRDLLERLILGLGGDRQDFLRAFPQSFMISADLAHAVHPNYPEKADPGHRPRINGGPVIKMAASQSYASDAHSASVFRQLAQEAGVPCQTFINRSDMRGGSTIGPMSSSLLPMPTVDVGNPIWGMHSCRETGGSLDQFYLTQVVKYFFSL